MRIIGMVSKTGMHFDAVGLFVTSVDTRPF